MFTHFSFFPAMTGGNTLTVSWRRLDVPGHDACRYVPGNNGWTLRGSAVFLEGEQVCRFHYEVVAGLDFRTREATVSGAMGETEVHLRIEAAGGRGWTVNGVAQTHVTDCVDLDLGFTPATNFLPIRRLALHIGQEAQAPAAWLALPRCGLEVLGQRYRRISATIYEYESPSTGYHDRLVCSAEGVIVSYPGLFEMEG